MTLNGVGVSYPQRKGMFSRSRYWALEDISFGINEGEIIGVIGRNGVGKSTLLRIMADIIRPDRGQVSRKAGVRTVLLSIQAGFIASLTGRQNIFISAITLGLSKRMIDARIDDIVGFSELRQFIDQPVASYSSGMRARLGFSIAMQVDPDILLIDEAISVGDEAFRKKSATLIHERVEKNETTVIVTHNVQLAKTLCTRAIFVEQGRVRASGDPEEVVSVYLGR
jgi:lipopolysaccharide transport system ATP-binding protein